MSKCRWAERRRRRESKAEKHRSQYEITEEDINDVYRYPIGGGRKYGRSGGVGLAGKMAAGRGGALAELGMEGLVGVVGERRDGGVGVGVVRGARPVVTGETEHDGDPGAEGEETQPVEVSEDGNGSHGQLACVLLAGGRPRAPSLPPA